MRIVFLPSRVCYNASGKRQENLDLLLNSVDFKVSMQLSASIKEDYSADIALIFNYIAKL